MNASHTPGPWAYQPLAGHHDFAIYAESTGRDLAIVRNFDEANARLIAAAPRLLAEAKELLRNVQSYQDGLAIVLTVDCEALEAAVKEAEEQL